MEDKRCPAACVKPPPPVPTCSAKLAASRIAGSGSGSGGTRGRFLGVLHKVRDPLAEYQESHGGLRRSEQYRFVTLITSMFHQGYQAALTILTMLYNLIPLVDGFLCLARFVLDKLIEIAETDSKPEMILKIGMFTVEIFVILIMCLLICGLVIFPVWQLFSALLSKFWGLLYG